MKDLESGLRALVIWVLWPHVSDVGAIRKANILPPPRLVTGKGSGTRDYDIKIEDEVQEETKKLVSSSSS